MKIAVKYISVFVFLLLLWAGFTVNAQEGWEDETGEIEDKEIVIEKNKKIELPPASRVYEKVSPPPLQNQSGEVRFDIKDFNYQLLDLNPRIRVLTIKDPLLKKLYANYFQVGGGNYGSALLEALINSKRNEKYSYGIHAKHQSAARGPVDKRNSANAENYIGLNGKSFSKQYVVSSNLKYRGRKNYFYGYDQRFDVERDTIAQNFANFYVDAMVETRDTEQAFYFQLKPSYSFLKDNFEARENIFEIDFNSIFNITENVGFDLSSDVFLSNRKDNGELVRKLVKIRPTVQFKVGNLDVDAGVNIVFESDTSSLRKGTRLYFIGNVKYQLGEHINLYGGFDGDMEAVSLHKLVDQNPFLNSQIELINTNKELEIYAGVHGSAFKSFSFNAGFKAGNYVDQYYFINDPSDTTKFNILYDGGTTARFNFFTEVGIEKTNVFKGAARFDFFAYDVSQVDIPWHKPSYKFSLLGVYNLFDKILFDSELYTLGGMRALDYNTDQSIDLNRIIDLNFKIDYRYSDQVSMFLSLNNVLAKNYQRYYNYPVRGFTAMIGLTYAFDRL